MKPKVGDDAPEFTAEVVGGAFRAGAQVSLAHLRGMPVVLVFYPKDNTPGCTIQACAIRDNWGVLESKAYVFGVSVDSAESHRKFINKRNLPYPLLVDIEKKIVNDYGVWVEKSIFGKKYMGIERTSFVIGADGKILAVLEKVKPGEHMEQLLNVLKEV